MIDQLNKKIGYDVFVAVNTNAMHMEYFINPQAFGTSSSLVFLFLFCQYGNNGI